MANPSVKIAAIISLVVVAVFVVAFCLGQQSSHSIGKTDGVSVSRPDSTVRDVKLDGYFARYCDYTGGMGIGFVASHTYDFKFRQHLKTTQDYELRRLFVLQNLYAEVESAISDFEQGIVMTGKGLSRQMNSDERASMRSRIVEQLRDLSRFDLGEPLQNIANLEERLNQVVDGKAQ